MGTEMRIVVSNNGPYQVSGDIPIRLASIVRNADGLSWDWEGKVPRATEPYYQLCRCGHSRSKPFCDGSHASIHFQDGLHPQERGRPAKP